MVLHCYFYGGFTYLRIYEAAYNCDRLDFLWKQKKNQTQQRITIQQKEKAKDYVTQKIIKPKIRLTINH